MRQDGTTILLGLPGVPVRHVERYEDDGMRVVHVMRERRGGSVAPQVRDDLDIGAAAANGAAGPPDGGEPLVVHRHNAQRRARAALRPPADRRYEAAKGQQPNREDRRPHRASGLRNSTPIAAEHGPKSELDTCAQTRHLRDPGGLQTRQTGSATRSHPQVLA